MPISFHGDVTINGNVEVFDNGSMKIVNNDSIVNVGDLKKYIEDSLPDSPRKEEYTQAAEIIANPPQDKGVIKEAVHAISDFIKDTGRAIIINGVSRSVLEIVAEIVKNQKI